MKDELYENESCSISEQEEEMLDRKKMSEMVKAMSLKNFSVAISMMRDFDEQGEQPYFPDFFYQGCKTCIKETPEISLLFLNGVSYCYEISKNLCQEKFEAYCKKICEEDGLSYEEKTRIWMAEDILSCDKGRYLDYTDAIPSEED